MSYKNSDQFQPKVSIISRRVLVFSRFINWCAARKPDPACHNVRHFVKHVVICSIKKPLIIHKTWQDNKLTRISETALWE